MIIFPSPAFALGRDAAHHHNTPGWPRFFRRGGFFIHRDCEPEARCALLRIGAPIGAPTGLRFAWPRLDAAYAFVIVFDTPAEPSCPSVLSCFESSARSGLGSVLRVAKISAP